MSTYYTVTMSSGETCRHSAANAGEAIYRALEKFPGKTVVKCHSGLTEEQVVEMRKQGKEGVMVGFVEHDIPVHQPIPE